MIRKCKRLVHIIVLTAGLQFVAVLFLACTPYPGRIFAWFGAPEAGYVRSPDWIVILGGGGIPSESGLMRCYLGAKVAEHHPGAQVMICLPTDGDPERSSVGRMRDELIMRGISPDRIHLEHHATTTHAQAVAVAGILARRGEEGARILVVSSGYHLRRAIGCFRKAGLPKSVGQTPVPVPDEYDLGDHVQLRYRFWNNLHMLVLSGREACAILVYRIRGYL